MQQKKNCNLDAAVSFEVSFGATLMEFSAGFFILDGILKFTGFSWSTQLALNELIDLLFCCGISLIE